MVKFLLQCAIVGREGDSFEVEIDDGVKVSKLKEIVKAGSDGIITGPHPNLQLFLAKAEGCAWLDGAGAATVAVDEAGGVPVMRDDHGNRHEFVQMDPLLWIKNPKHFGENFQPGEGQIHVLVVVPDGGTGDRLEPRDSSNEWLSEFLTHRVKFASLPFVGSLEDFVAQPLPVKIRAKKKWLDKWGLSPALQDKLFVLDDTAPCMKLKTLIFGERSLSRVSNGQTKNSYILAWDLAFRCVLDVIFSQARIDRDSCNGSSTGTPRPDFLFMLDGVCVFRGEEKSPDVNISVPTEELRSNLVWGYGDVPYVFGYAASGLNTGLFALRRGENGDVTTIPIGAFNLDVHEHRFKVVLAILNMALLFQAIVDACPASGKDEFKKITRSSGVVLHLFPTQVKKVFPNNDSFERLSRLYGQMAAAGVPNVDRLIETQYNKNSMSFEPRGTIVKPSNRLELFGALRDVLQALVALHDLGWIHRDIRWSNPSSSGQHLSRSEHAPEIFVDNGTHTTAVEVWAVGFLIETVGTHVRWQDLVGRSAFYERLVAKDPAKRPSAEEALADLLVHEEEAKREQETDLKLQRGENSRRGRVRTRKRKH
ncbi:unnamed protein product [Phytophthora lilii]|uniref:Unnamed protein product n=1 Tax=Phytophthora lilii TaxID=2077276 RepID=A0A9W6WRZ6_9STRA|nr:unnamed protein product [Phytophthora lilii]